jgi:hypothetical protein
MTIAAPTSAPPEKLGPWNATFDRGLTRLLGLRRVGLRFVVRLRPAKSLGMSMGMMRRAHDTSSDRAVISIRYKLS